jgi:Fic family protein
VFQTASPFDTPRLMTELVAWMNQERETARLHPLPIIALCIVVFLEIHPFQDGNGRVTIGEAIKLTGASRNTLKQHFRALVQRGTLDQQGRGRGVWYGLR